MTARPMRVLVCPHELVTGGSQLTAIAFAERLRDRGHEVEVYAPPGPLAELVRRQGLTYRAAPASRTVGPRSVLAMSREIGRFAPDIVHTFESAPTVSSAAASLLRPHRTVTTMLSMDVPDYVPTHAPLLVGTAALAEEARAHRDDVHLMEPPIDVDHDAPGDVAAAREALGIGRDAFVVAVVGRLSAEHHKAAGIVAAIEEMTAHPDLPPTVLLVAGSGDEAARVRDAAARAAAGADRLDIRLLGDVSDPRAVYDAADVVFGMGSSALRAMAHAKPLIVQGRDGFWELLTPATAPLFLAQGFFGEGPTGERFVDLLGELRDENRRAELSGFGYTLVHERYALAAAVDRLEAIYAAEIERRRTRTTSVRSVVASLLRFARFRIAITAPAVPRLYRRLTGRAA
jgi:glycosyltransferase involved in cell wall biosynthesis